MDMKATGSVRRVDDLGRVVIPKEIRRTLHINEGDPLEIYTDNDGGVTFKKYVWDDMRVEKIVRGMTETAKILEQPVLLARPDGSIFTCAGLEKTHISAVEVIEGKPECKINIPFVGQVYLPKKETAVLRYGVNTGLYVQAAANIPFYSNLEEKSNNVTAILCLSNKPVEVLPPSAFKMFQLAVSLLGMVEEDYSK